MILISSNFRSKERNHKANSEFAFIILNLQMQKERKKIKANNLENICNR